MLMVIVAGCSNGSEQDALKELVKNQNGIYSVHIFSNKTLEGDFEKQVNETINKINNQFLKEEGITNISFVDVRDKGEYDYAKVLEIDSYPQIILLETEKIAYRTNDPDELYEYFEKKTLDN